MGQIVLYKGRKGSGKTLTMIKDGFNFFLDGYMVLRNLNCTYGTYISEDDILKLDKNSEIKNCVIMLDELQIFFDSRKSMRKQNVQFSNFIQQVRKRNIILLATTQYSNTIDLRFRQHVDVVCYPNYYKEFKVCECVYVDMTSIEDNILQEINQPRYVKLIYDAVPIFQMYETEQMI